MGCYEAQIRILRQGRRLSGECRSKYLGPSTFKPETCKSSENGVFNTGSSSQGLSAGNHPVTTCKGRSCYGDAYSPDIH
ncbi:hypothetical protein DENSPDRAFT_838661 [Dentipellis sp. KUC8613]|nr:hypothetical protein DENSPDRAFT_838661 [Dentipellis sp. KUC8613]